MFVLFEGDLEHALGDPLSDELLQVGPVKVVVSVELQGFRYGAAGPTVATGCPSASDRP